MKQDSLSVVIVAYNCWNYLDRCLRSVLASTSSAAEIIVVDNASIDGTAEKVRQEYPQVALIANTENLGAIRGVNQGYRAATGKRILLLDADTELQRDAMALLSEFLDEHPEVALVVPRTFNDDGTIQETARRFPSVINGIFGRQSFLTKLFPANPFSRRYLLQEYRDSQAPFQVEMVSCACLMLRRSVLESAGFLDEGYGKTVGYWNDADWCKRIQKSGGLLYCLPKAVVAHHEQNRPFRKRNPYRIIEFHTGAYRFYRLHYTRGQWDPRRVVAGLLLTARALLLLALNALKPAGGPSSDPMSQKK